MAPKHSGFELIGPVHDAVGPGNAGDVFASRGAGNIPAWTHPSDLAVDYGLAFIGTVTGIAGAPNFQCSGLIGFGEEFFKDYWSYVVWDAGGLGGAPQGEMLECTGYSSATGDFTVAAYTVGIAVGDKVLLLHPSLAKLAGEAPVTGTANKTWNTGEADVVSIGADDTKNKLHSLLLSIHNLVGTIITVRMYMEVKGTERKVYEQAFDATSDPPGLWIVNGTIGIHEVLRVTLQSNAAADDNKDVDYDYMLEAM